MAATAPTLRVKSKTFTQASEKERLTAAADEAFLKAVDDGDVAAIESSDRKGADVNVADERGSTAVHKAMRHSTDTKLLAILIDRGAWTEFADADGNRPAAIAIRFDNTKALKLLLEAKGPTGEYLVDRLQVNADTGNNLMHEAAWYDRDECAEVLLATGAFTPAVLEQANKAGQTSMHVASFRARKPFMQLLVEAGANPEAVTSNPRTMKQSPMQLAVTMGKPANAKYLEDLSVAIASIRFASRMRRRHAAASKKGSGDATASGTKAPIKLVPTATVVTPAAVAVSDKPAAAPDEAAEKAPAEAAEKAPAEAAVLCLRFEGTLQLFTADMEKSFLARLAKYVDVPVENLHVLSRTAGSVVLHVAIDGPNSSHAAERVVTAELASLSEALDVTMLAKSMGQRGTGVAELPPVVVVTASAPASAPAPTLPVSALSMSPRRATPEYRAISSSPATANSPVS